MYSLLLMATMTTGSATPAHLFHGCHGCHGYRSSCFGCYGGCNGCCGGRVYYGCSGCCGGCYGRVIIYQGTTGTGATTGTSSGTGGTVKPQPAPKPAPKPGETTAPKPAPKPGDAAPKPKAGGDSAAPKSAAPAKPAAPKPAAPEKKKETPKPPEASAHRATVIVEVAEDAKLFFDDVATKETGRVRTFTTPALEPGQNFAYDVRVESVRDGKTVTTTKNVIVRAGATIRVDMNPVATTTTASR